MPYCITLRSRTDASITAWYDGSRSRWSTDQKRQKLFDKKREAKPVCHELRKLCPRNVKVINIEPPMARSELARAILFNSFRARIAATIYQTARKRLTLQTQLATVTLALSRPLLKLRGPWWFGKED
jgi:hypothetical protein